MMQQYISMMNEGKVYSPRFWLLDSLPEYTKVWCFKAAQVSGEGMYNTLQISPSAITLRYIVAGNWYIEMHGKRQKAKPGEIFLTLPSAKTAFGQNSEKWHWLELQFCGSGAMDFIEDCGYKDNTFITKPDNPEKTLELFLQIYELMGQPNRATTKMLSLLFDLNYQCRHHTGSNHEIMQRSYEALVARAVNYFESEFPTVFNITALAEKLGVDRTTLGRAFKVKTGKSPHQFWDELKFYRSCDYLLSTSVSISEIASRTGFSNVQYFTNWFKKKTGKSPGKWRAKARL